MSSIPDEDLAPDTNHGNAFPEDWFWLDQINHSTTKAMNFDRFDICEAHYVFAMLWHGGMGSSLYAKFAQLERIKFRPSPMLSGPKGLTENGQEIYQQLLITHGFES